MRKNAWSAEQIALLGTASDSVIAKKLGKKEKTVAMNRINRGIPCFCKEKVQKRAWDSPDNVALLGKIPDKSLAERIGVSVRAVQQARNNRGISPYRPLTILKWNSVKNLTQPDFYQALKRAVPHVTYKWLAERCFVSHSRVQKWFAPGSGQDKLSMQQRHHFFLVCMLESMQVIPDEITCKPTA